jgi:uncharacterized integral membrane protein
MQIRFRTSPTMTPEMTLWLGGLIGSAWPMKPSAIASTTNAGHIQAPRHRQRVRAIQAASMIEEYGAPDRLKRTLTCVTIRRIVPPTNAKPDETSTKPEGSSPSRRPEWPLDSRDTARLVAIGAVALFGLLFVILNIHNVSINFVLFDAHVPLLVALLLAGGIGVGAGWLLADRQAGRKTRFKPR